MFTAYRDDLECEVFIILFPYLYKLHIRSWSPDRLHSYHYHNMSLSLIISNGQTFHTNNPHTNTRFYQLSHDRKGQGTLKISNIKSSNDCVISTKQLITVTTCRNGQGKWSWFILKEVVIKIVSLWTFLSLWALVVN